MERRLPRGVERDIFFRNAWSTKTNAQKNVRNARDLENSKMNPKETEGKEIDSENAKKKGRKMYLVDGCASVI